MYIPMTDLKIQHALIKEQIEQAIRRVMDSGRFILGQEVEAFEQEIAAYCGTKYAIGVASGTDALILSLAACDIGTGDEVITTPFTFFATVEAIIHLGAHPVFADIDPITFNLDPEKVKSRITSRTRAIIPVHLFGQPVEMDPILELARKDNLKVIEDCAQALSAEYRGKKVGSLGDAGCLSFFPSKNLGACGDGGVVLTSDEKIAEKVRLLRNHGTRATYLHSRVGFNSRLDAIQAAILRVKLNYLDNWSEMRRRNLELYNRLLGEIGGIRIPLNRKDTRPSVNYYTIRLVDRSINRERLRENLRKRGIDTAVYYPLSLHLQEACRSLGYRYGDFPESERTQEQVLSLPMYPELSREQIEEIAGGIKQCIQSIQSLDGFRLSL